MIFSSTILSFHGHEEYGHGFHLPCVPYPRKRAPNLSFLDRFLCGLWIIFLEPLRIGRTASLVKPSPFPTVNYQANDGFTGLMVAAFHEPKMLFRY
jgi:hypothetical protein